MKNYPKTVRVKQTALATGASKVVSVLFRSAKHEQKFWESTAGMLPNFKHEIASDIDEELAMRERHDKAQGNMGRPEF